MGWGAGLPREAGAHRVAVPSAAGTVRGFERRDAPRVRSAAVGAAPAWAVTPPASPFITAAMRR